MATDTEKKTHLLINDYRSIDNFRKAILDAQYRAIDQDTPACRFRGTLIDLRNGFDDIRITGWQRNISRLRKMDVSLPTIITMKLDNGIIKDIELDRSFMGSKGLVCSRKYLDMNIKSKIEGRGLDAGFIQDMKLEKTHCFHIFEVLSGIYTYFNILKENNFRESEPDKYAYEEEAIDSYNENGTLHSLGVQFLKGRAPLKYELILHDILNKIRFDKSGVLKTEQGVVADFSINGTFVLNGSICINNRIPEAMDLSKFLFKCIRNLKDVLYPETSIKIFNTNLYPQAYIGMLIQSLAIRSFNNNYNYIMHALTALQRAGGMPLCVGSLTDQSEADRCFPGYDFADLV